MGFFADGATAAYTAWKPPVVNQLFAAVGGSLLALEVRKAIRHQIQLDAVLK